MQINTDQNQGIDPECLSMPIIADQFHSIPLNADQSELIGIGINATILIGIYLFFNYFILIGIDEHWASIEGIL